MPHRLRTLEKCLVCTALLRCELRVSQLNWLPSLYWSAELCFNPHCALHFNLNIPLNHHYHCQIFLLYSTFLTSEIKLFFCTVLSDELFDLDELFEPCTVLLGEIFVLAEPFTGFDLHWQYLFELVPSAPCLLNYVELRFNHAGLQLHEGLLHSDV